MKITQVTSTTQSVYFNLMQGYEAEFSAITRKLPDENGLFALDTHLSATLLERTTGNFPNELSEACANACVDALVNECAEDCIEGCVVGFLAWQESVPIGFMTIALSPGQQFEVCEFYIVPCLRHKKLGSKLAAQVWSRFPGTWVVKQIEGAEYATQFWRKCIGEFLRGAHVDKVDARSEEPDGFEQDQFVDPYWGLVTRQTFAVADDVCSGL